MNLWLVVVNYGQSVVIEAEDFYEIHNQVDSDNVVAVIHLDNDMVEQIKNRGS